MSRGAVDRTALGVVALLTLAAGCSTSDAQEADGVPPAAVALEAPGVDRLDVGVVVTLGDAPLAGAQWARAAEGAQVAAHRFGLTDTDVRIVPLDDRGTEGGLRSAVDELEEQGVGAIVVATDGEHVTAALPELGEAAAPVLLPYWSGDAPLPEGVWSTGSARGTNDDRLVEHLSAEGLAATVLVDAGGGPVRGLEPVATVEATDAAGIDDVADRLDELADAEDGPQVDSIVVSGPATLQARVVAEVAGADVTVPVLLGHDALSPRFAPALDDAGASLSTPLVSVGADAGDVSGAIAGDGAAAAFFQGLRGAAADTERTDYFDGEPFASVAGDADTASHDAVVAAVRAAAEAESTEPGAVAEALGGLSLGAADGIVGPALDLSESAAADEAATVVLQSTPQDPQARSIDPEVAHLFWFALPDDA